MAAEVAPSATKEPNKKACFTGISIEGLEWWALEAVIIKNTINLFLAITSNFGS